ncbi:MAG: RHS repeat protein [Holophagaceae bacterium]|nr:RHS repeat protein [Holophagaceae bacterium]
MTPRAFARPLPLLALLLCGGPVLAQSFQSSFANVAFDRAKAPSSFHGVVEVEAPTGAASITLPLGPGIGARGLHFTPTFSFRASPQLRISNTSTEAILSSSVDQPTILPQSIDELYFESAGLASLSPGYLDLALFLGIHRRQSNWRLPNGGSGSVLGELPAAVSSSAAAHTVISAFGYAGETISLAPHYSTDASFSEPFVKMGSDDSLVVGLAGDELSVPVDYSNGTTVYKYTFPHRVLVVRQDVAYEFDYVSHHSRDIHVPYVSNRDKSPLDYARYVIKKATNRFGESVLYTYDPGGLSYTATWSKDSSVYVKVERECLRTALSQGVPSLGRSDIFHTMSSTILVSYGGVQASTYRVQIPANETGPVCQPISGGGSGTGTYLDAPWGSWEGFQPLRVTEEASGESVEFGYSTGPGVAWVIPWLIFPTVLSSVRSAHKTTNLTWEPYRFRINYNPFQWQGMVAGNPAGRPAFALGVTHIDDEDLVTHEHRVTTHQRAVPQINWIEEPGQPYPGESWTSTAFYDAITHPDGRITVLKFVEPPASNGTTGAEGLQNQAHLKHLVAEQREYQAGANWQGDLGAAPGSTGTYRATLSSGWDLHSIGNSAGLTGLDSVPYPLQTETWEQDLGVYRLSRKEDWNGTGWQRSINAIQGGGTFDRNTQFTLTSNPGAWLFNLPEYEATTGQPARHRVFNSNGTVDEETIDGAPDGSLTLKFTYHPGLPTPSAVRLSSASFYNPSVVGADYGVDGWGFINSIQLLGAAYSVSQENDALGRPKNQTDANGHTTGFEYDTVGRLTDVRPPSPQLPTHYGYGSDNLSVTQTRGLAGSTFHYDGFGQLSGVDRLGGASMSLGYDSAGRKNYESVWGGGAAHSYGYDHRDRMTSHVDPNGIHTDTAYSGLSRTVTVGSLVTSFQNDGLGRLSKVTDALGNSTTYDYDDGDRILHAISQDGASGPTQTRTWGYNGLGWLKSLNQPESGDTTYSDFTVQGKPKSTNYNGKVVTATVDSLGRVRTVDGPDVHQAFDFDGGAPYNGKLRAAEDKAVRLEYGYDGQGLLSDITTKIYASGQVGVGPEDSYTQSFGYDSAYGLRTSHTIGGRMIGFDYDRVKGLPTSVGTVNQPLASAGYDPTSWSLNYLGFPTAGASSTFSYDPDQLRLKTLSHAGPAAATKSWIYTYGTHGDAAQGEKIGMMLSDGEDAFDYDKLGRLTKATVKLPAAWGSGQSLVQEFEYDGFGNQIKSTTENSPNPVPWGLQKVINNFQFTLAEQGSLIARNQLPITAGGSDTGARYDDQGNLKQIFKTKGDAATQVELTYDALGRVVEMVDAERSVKERYFYSPEGLRTRIETYRYGGLIKVQHKLYNDQRQLVSEYEAVPQ